MQKAVSDGKLELLLLEISASDEEELLRGILDELGKVAELQENNKAIVKTSTVKKPALQASFTIFGMVYDIMDINIEIFSGLGGIFLYSPRVSYSYFSSRSRDKAPPSH